MLQLASSAKMCSLLDFEGISDAGTNRGLL